MNVKKTSLCVETKKQLNGAYHAFMDNEELVMPDFRVLKPFSTKEASDFREALRGDYDGNYHISEDDIFLLPEHRVFEERIEHSKFDNINLESDALKFRFFVPFIIKAELKPGLAFGEVLLTLVHILTLISVLINGMTFIAMIVGGISLFLLLMIVHFWYGMARYPSIWNRFAPHGLKGAPLDRNFLEIRNICSYHCNGHDRTFSQFKQFLITLPFTIIYHANAFGVTVLFFIFKISGNGGKRSKLPPPVITSLLLSNILITSFWFLGGTSGMIFSTCTVIFNQKAYDSLLFNRDLKGFCMSLVFGNLVVIQRKLTIGKKEVALSANAPEHDIEIGIQIEKSVQGDCNSKPTFGKSKVVGETQLPFTSTPVVSIRSASSQLDGNESLLTNSWIDKSPEQNTTPPTNSSTDPPQKNHLATIQNIISFKSDEEPVETNFNNETTPEIFMDESLSQQSGEMTLQYLVTVMPTRTERSEKTETKSASTTKPSREEPEEIRQKELDVNTKVKELSTKSSKKKFFGFQRFFSSPRKRNSSKRHWPDDEGEDELSVEFLNPSDVHLDKENHPSTMEWQNTIAESVQRFRVKSYSLRKHNWVMNRMYGKSFFIKENGRRRRKLKRKEIKQYCKAFHDKQLLINSQLSGILDDLKDLKKNHTSNSKSNSDHTRNSSVTNPLEQNEKTNDLSHILAAVDEKLREKHANSDSNDNAVKSICESSTKDSDAQSSKESTVSTLTQSLVPFEHGHPYENKSIPWIPDPTLKFKENESPVDSRSFGDKINGLLQCGPWIDNMTLLRESGSMQHESEDEHDEADLQNDTPRGNNNGGLKSCMKETGHEDGETPVGLFGSVTEDGIDNVISEAYWRAFVDEKKIVKPKLNKKNENPNSSPSSGETVDATPAVVLKSRKGRKLYPWTSDLQKKKIEKARESRSQDKEKSIKKTKRIVTIFKKKKNDPFKVVVEEHTTHSPRTIRNMERNANESCQEDRHETVENQRHDDMGDEHLREGGGGNSNFRHNTKSSDSDNPEMTTRTKQTKRTNTPGVNREADVDPRKTATEQREEEDLLSDVRLMSEREQN